MYLLERKRFLGAAVLGCLAAMTKLVGVLTIIPYAFYCLDWKPLRVNWRKLIYGAIIPCGYGFYSLINYRLFGNAQYYMDVQRDHWTKRSVNPLSQYWSAWVDVLRENNVDSHWLKQSYILDYAAMLLSSIDSLAYLARSSKPNRLPL